MEGVQIDVSKRSWHPITSSTWVSRSFVAMCWCVEWSYCQGLSLDPIVVYRLKGPREVCLTYLWLKGSYLWLKGSC